jgi:hypothetical protein
VAKSLATNLFSTSSTSLWSLFCRLFESETDGSCTFCNFANPYKCWNIMQITSIIIAKFIAFLRNNAYSRYFTTVCI